MNVPVVVYILGKVLQVEAAFMALPFFVGLCYREQEAFAFLLVGVIAFLAGWLVCRKKPESNSFYAREGFVTVSLSWIFLGIIGALPFLLNGDITNPLDAVFEMVSGFTTTGCSILSDIEQLHRCSLIWRCFANWIGGMGVLLFVLSILPLAGAQNIYLMRAEVTGPSVGKLVPKVRSTAANLYKIYCAMTALEFLFLLVGGLDPFTAVSLSFATAGTGGFAVLNSSCAQYSVYVQVVITVFMVMCGVNFSVYYLLLHKKFRQAFSYEELRWYIGIFVAATALIVINTVSRFGSVAEAIQQAAFTVAAILTTTGFTTVDFSAWPEFSKMILLALMFVGGCAGSTAGGLKISRIVIYGKSIKKMIEQYLHPRSIKVVKFEGKQVEHDVIRGVNMFLITFIFLFGASLLLVSLDKYNFETNFTAVAAMLNNIGVGMAGIGPLHNFSGFSPLSKLVLIFDMLAGRLEIFPILLLFAPSTYKK